MPELLVNQGRVGRIDGDHHGERARAFDVSKKLQSEPLSLVSTFDDPRDVRHGEAPKIGQLHNSQIWRECRERVVRHFRCGLGDGGQKRRLARVRLTDESNICHQLELDLHPTLFTSPSRLPTEGCLVRRGREVHVSTSTSPPLSDYDLVSWL